MKKVNISSYEYKIGQNIARLRKATGLSQADMEDYGISRAYYGKIELGLHNITLSKMKLIAHALGVTCSSLFRDENDRDIV